MNFIHSDCSNSFQFFLKCVHLSVNDSSTVAHFCNVEGLSKTTTINTDKEKMARKCVPIFHMNLWRNLLNKIK
jgi:hypothetical protein